MPEIYTHPITVKGQAVDQSGRPVPGAKIYLASGEPGYKRVAETTAKEDGRYEFRDVALPIKSAEPPMKRRGRFPGLRAGRGVWIRLASPEAVLPRSQYGEGHVL